MDEIYTNGYENIDIPSNDIALIKLAGVVEKSSYVEPACLPTSEEDFPASGTKCWIVGWGRLGKQIK